MELMQIKCIFIHGPMVHVDIMRLTTFTDYSLRVLIYLAAAPGHRSTIGEVAAAYGISEHHLVKVVQFLGKEGILINTRGRGGGMQLAHAPAAINVGRVVRLAEGESHPAECFESDTNTCGLSGVCHLQRVLGEAVKAFHATLERYTLEDLRIPAPRLHAALNFHPPHGR
jgi:Rrf2 family transcriptional regulator, nitric oxide-sensitive transcriptional repressor